MVTTAFLVISAKLGELVLIEIAVNPNKTAKVIRWVELTQQVLYILQVSLADSLLVSDHPYLSTKISERSSGIPALGRLGRKLCDHSHPMHVVRRFLQCVPLIPRPPVTFSHTLRS